MGANVIGEVGVPGALARLTPTIGAPTGVVGAAYFVLLVGVGVLATEPLVMLLGVLGEGGACCVGAFDGLLRLVLAEPGGEGRGFTVMLGLEVFLSFTATEPFN